MEISDDDRRLRIQLRYQLIILNEEIVKTSAILERGGLEPKWIRHHLTMLAMMREAVEDDRAEIDRLTPPKKGGTRSRASTSRKSRRNTSSCG